MQRLKLSGKNDLWGCDILAERYYFFNSTADDRRRYQASDMAEYWMSFLRSGLIHENGKPQLEVVADGTSRNVTLKVGRAIIKGHLYINDADLKKTIDEPDSVFDRIDRLVLRYDNSLENRYIKSFIKKGEPGENPEPPALTREGEIYELSLAQIRVKAGKAFIDQSDIIDERFVESVCGLASSLVTVPTDHLMREWNEWFNSIKDNTYVTRKEFIVDQGEVKREIANLNLHLEASKRVVNGVTFGTNFDTTFGMEIDFTRSRSQEALSVGQTEITLDDASGFKVGQEVTIYDDVNLERRKILNITGNTIAVDALTKEFKAGANVARTMAIYDEINKLLEFGHFGTLEWVTVDGEAVPYTPNTSSLISLQGDIFYVDTNYYVNIRKQDGTWLRSNALPLSGGYRMQGDVTTDGQNYVFIFTSERDEQFDYYTTIRVHAVDKQGNIRKSISLGGGDSYHVQKAKYHEGVIYYLREQYGGQKTLFKITFDGTNFSSPTQIATGLNQGSFVVLNPNEFIAFGFTGTQGTICKITGSTVSNQYTFSQSGIVWGGILNGKFSFISVNNGEVNIHQTEDYILWTTKTYSLGVTPSKVAVVVDAEETIHLVLIVNSALYTTKKKSNDTDFESLKRYGTVTGTNMVLGKADNQKINRPLLFLDQKLVAELLVGEGAPITVNDVRFKIKPTHEVVAWIKHDEGLTITEGDFNGHTMDLTTVDNETQLVGVKFDDEPGEIRFTMERQSIDDNVKVTRILGGVS